MDNIDQSIVSIGKERFVFTVAIYFTLGLINMLHYSKYLLEAVDVGDIGERLASQLLNEAIPVKAFLQLFLTILFGVFAHPYLLILNLPMMIWRSKKLFLGYDRCRIANPGQTNKYIRHLKFQLMLCWACLTIYVYYWTKYVIN